MITPSPQEEFLLKVLREAKPYESVLITKDKDGKPDRYMVQRTEVLEGDLGTLAVLLQDVKPYERIELAKDKEGSSGRCVLHRSQKIMVSEIRIEEIK